MNKTFPLSIAVALTIMGQGYALAQNGKTATITIEPKQQPFQIFILNEKKEEVKERTFDYSASLEIPVRIVLPLTATPSGPESPKPDAKLVLPPGQETGKAPSVMGLMGAFESFDTLRKSDNPEVRALAENLAVYSEYASNNRSINLIDLRTNGEEIVPENRQPIREFQIFATRSSKGTFLPKDNNNKVVPEVLTRLYWDASIPIDDFKKGNLGGLIKATFELDVKKGAAGGGEKPGEPAINTFVAAFGFNGIPVDAIKKLVNDRFNVVSGMGVPNTGPTPIIGFNAMLKGGERRDFLKYPLESLGILAAKATESEGPYILAPSFAITPNVHLYAGWGFSESNRNTRTTPVFGISIGIGSILGSQPTETIETISKVNAKVKNPTVDPKAIEKLLSTVSLVEIVGEMPLEMAQLIYANDEEGPSDSRPLEPNKTKIILFLEPQKPVHGIKFIYKGAKAEIYKFAPTPNSKTKVKSGPIIKVPDTDVPTNAPITLEKGKRYYIQLLRP